MAGLAGAAVMAACAPAQPTAAPAAEAKPAEKAAEAKPAASTGPWAGYAAKNKDQWAKIPADHKKGTLIPQSDWYKMLGDPPKEAIYLAAFFGGWGDKWGDIMIEQIKKEHPGVEVTKDFDPRIEEKMKPRIVAGDIPDWSYSAVPLGGAAGITQLAKDKVIVPLDFMLDLEAYGYPGKRMEEIMADGALKGASAGLTDHQWAMPMSQYCEGIYYNAALFEANNWPSPDTLSWEEFMDLQKKIAEKIPPWTHQGKYPTYWRDCILRTLQYKKAGAKAFCDIDNLVEGAYTTPDILWGIEQLQAIFKNGWTYPGSEAMTHTEGQQVFVDGKAAMVPCGSWLENEQKKTTPADFRMKISNTPQPKDGKGEANSCMASAGGAELSVGNGNNPLWGMELMRMFFSPAVVKHWAEVIGTPLSTKGALEGAKVSEALQSAVAMIDKAKGLFITQYYDGWYPAVAKQYTDSFGDILWTKTTAKEAGDMQERAAKEVREDKTIEKYTRTDCG
jgi:N-acetylglucosamine transport system substrate-binding protein